MTGILRILAVQDIDEAYEATDAFRKVKEKNYDAVIADIVNGHSDAIGLAKLVRADGSGSNPHVPILAICSQRAINLVDQARDAGVSELIRVPYSTQVISETLNYVFNLDSEQLEYYATSQEAPNIEVKETVTDQAEEEEAFSITNMLLDHYIKHNEIVLAKLRFAQEATKTCISQLRDTYSKVKEEDDTSIREFKDFDTMWEEIITMFIKGGLSEEDIFNIEKTVLAIPDEIKTHYDDLSSQDKSFMNMLEAINEEAYKRAKDRVMQLHKTPNPLNGKTSEDYKISEETTQSDESGKTKIKAKSSTIVIDPRNAPNRIIRS